MSNTLILTGRALRLYYRDRAAVFFSLLAPLILVALYAFFLGSLQVEGMKEWFPNALTDDIKWFVDAWVLAGIVMITTLTTSLAAMGAFVEDRASGRFNDFVVSPVRRGQLILGYLFAALIISFSMSALIVVLGQIYLLILGHPLMSVGQWGRVVLYVALSSAAFSALSSFVVAFLKTSSSFASLSTIVGTISGFLAGAYIAPGVLPKGVVNVMNSLPFAQSAMLIRGPMTEDPLATLSGGDSPTIEALEEYYGITAAVGSLEITPLIACITLVVTFVVFAGLGTAAMSRRVK